MPCFIFAPIVDHALLVLDPPDDLKDLGSAQAVVRECLLLLLNDFCRGRARTSLSNGMMETLSSSLFDIFLRKLGGGKLSILF